MPIAECRRFENIQQQQQEMKGRKKEASNEGVRRRSSRENISPYIVSWIGSLAPRQYDCISYSDA